ncbi:MAG: winged helix-turn-helix domain-containing protein [Promethearchaeota archaeon]
MAKNEDFISKIDEKFEFLNNRITFLQDLILNMKNEFDLINRTKIDNQCITELTDLSENNLDHFLAERPSDCKLLEKCTTFVEKTTMKVLNIYLKKGINPAQELLNSYINFSENYLETGKCSDKTCMENVINGYKSLQDILNSKKLITDEMTANLFSKKHLYNIIDGNEKEDSKLLTPLSNEIRIKILKVVSKGGTYYSQLEREVGIKGGSFHFHLDKLVEGGYIIQEGEKGPYIATINGLKALQFLFELKKHFLLYQN